MSCPVEALKSMNNSIIDTVTTIDNILNVSHINSFGINKIDLSVNTNGKNDIKKFEKNSNFIENIHPNNISDESNSDRKRKVDDSLPYSPSKSSKTALQRTTSFDSTRSGNLSPKSLTTSPLQLMESSKLDAFKFSMPSKKFVPILISIEGNIGAGKSYLMSSLRNSFSDRWTFIDEPVDLWTSLKNEDNQSLLELFYNDQRRWSYTFQNCAVLSRFHLIEDAVKNRSQSKAIFNPESDPDTIYHVFITERCLQTDFEVFTKMLYDDHKLDALEYQLYKRWFNFLQHDAKATPLSGIVYVDTEPELCAERIKLRGRSGEDGIPLDYLKSLDYYQRKWVDRCEDTFELTSQNSQVTDHEKISVVRLKSGESLKVEEFVSELIASKRGYIPLSKDIHSVVTPF